METQAVIAALSALAQASRLGAYRLLVEAGPRGLAAGDIAEGLGVSPATLSFHLKLLHFAGLVESERQGRSIRYTARFDTMNGLVDYLTANCCGGDPQACMPARARPKKKRVKRTG